MTTTRKPAPPISRAAVRALRSLAPKPPAQPPARLQLRVMLDDVPLPVWRRLLVRNDLSLRQLHTALQRAMGWHDAHLHEFHVGTTRIGEPEGDLMFVSAAPAARVLDGRKTKLATVLAGKKKFGYRYDFGDDWRHTIVIEGVLPLDEAAPAVELLDGGGACPPEDCGGPGGYAELMAILADPSHAEHEEAAEHFGTLDPAAFDLVQARKRLAPRGRAKTRKA